MPHALYALLALAMYVLTAARLSRIVTTDKIGQPLRQAAMDRWGVDDMRTFGLHCDWCVGWWFCLVLAFPTALVAGLPWWWGWGLWPAGSYLVGLLARD